MALQPWVEGENLSGRQEPGRAPQRREFRARVNEHGRKANAHARESPAQLPPEIPCAAAGLHLHEEVAAAGYEAPHFLVHGVGERRGPRGESDDDGFGVHAAQAIPEALEGLAQVAHDAGLVSRRTW